MDFITFRPLCTGFRALKSAVGDLFDVRPFITDNLEFTGVADYVISIVAEVS
jgi:hypothetical protein